MKKKFVRTKDLRTAELLEKNGYTLVSKKDNTWIFINDGKETFEAKGKVVFTNIISV